MKVITATIAGSIFFSSNLQCYALPGDNARGAIEHFNSNSLSRNAQFGEFRIGANIASYESKLKYNDQTLNISIRLPERNGRAYEDIVESFYIENSSIGSRLEYTDYNLRKDDNLLNIVEGLWGQAVAQDFLNSSFTNRFKNRLREQSISTLYKGRKFGYVAQYITNPYPPSTTFSFTVSSLRDWKIFQLPVTGE